MIGTVDGWQTASGMAISPKGELALVANRQDGTISVLSIRGKEEVKVTDTVTVGAPPTGLRRRDRPGRQARARGQSRRQQDRAACRSTAARGPTTSATCRPGVFPYNRRRQAGRQARADGRQRQ